MPEESWLYRPRIGETIREEASAGAVVPKKFKLSADQIREIAKGFGSCFATDEIMVNGARIGYMYREEPDRSIDSGWRFFAGRESPEYLDDPKNTGVYDVNTVANYDPEIIPLLDSPIGSAFIRSSESGKLIPDPHHSVDVQESDRSDEPARAGRGLHPGFPVVSGRYALTKNWVVTLPGEFNRRVENGQMVLWKPGLTIWMSVWGAEEGVSAAENAERVLGQRGKGSYELERQEDSGVIRASYRIDEEEEGRKVFSLTAMAFAEVGHIFASIYFDDPKDLSEAKSIWLSLDLRGNQQAVPD